MSIDHNESWKRARDGAPFSNGTEGEMWEENWCGRCLRDVPFRRGITDVGCPLLLIAFSGKTPAEWLEQPADQYPSDAYHCIEFKPPGGGGGGEPRPQPEPPDMDGLFPRPDRQTRMYVQPRLLPVEAS